MKTWLAFSTCALLFSALAWTQIASADTAAATCEVRKDGEKQGGKSGPGPPRVAQVPIRTS